ncbi:MAG: thiol-activated cytolysin C-terminal domain-containing protein [Saprospiraceae bacterium]
MNRTNIFILLFSLLFSLGTSAQSTLRMNSNQRLDKGQKIEVAGKGYLAMQTDGNLVVYDAANVPKWATGTYGKTVTHAIMQTDGNLVIYNNTTPVWASDSWNLGANGGYFEVDLLGWQVAIYKAGGTVAKLLQATTVVVNTGTPIIISDPVIITNTNIGTGTITTGNQPLQFPRQQNWEADMCKALGLTGVGSSYASLTPFQQAIGSMGLEATEAFFAASGTPNLTPAEALNKMNSEIVISGGAGVATSMKSKITGVIGALVIDKIKKNGTDAQSMALKDWASQVYRQIKVDAALGTLKEYYVWKNNPCTYSAPGYTKPQDCYAIVGNNPYNSMWKTSKPPHDLLLKAGLTYAAGGSNQIVQGVSGAVAGIGLVAGFAAATSGLGVATTGVGPTSTALFYAFGSGSGAAGAIGATSWAGVVTGPAAVIAASVLIGIIQGAAVIEGEQAEWKLKQAIRAAMSENINMANVVADQNAGALFMIGLVKSAQNNWKAPSLEIEGEVTFFCEAGYVSKFYLNYTLNGQAKSFSTNDMSAGYWQKFTIPAAAKNIQVKGVMIAAGEKTIFTQNLERPTYICYKVYGTVFQQAWNNDWPLSVGGEVSESAGKIKFTHGAGFVANWQITYDLPGKPGQNINPTGTTLGWNKTYNLPLDATNVRILVQGATGLVWEPWRTTYDKTFPTVPNMCIKIYGTTLDQKWNSDCN